MRELLFGKSLPELQQLCVTLGWPRFRAKQIYQGIHAQGCRDFSQLRGLSRAERDYLEQHYELACYEPLKQQKAKDGTIKFLYPLEEYYLSGHSPVATQVAQVAQVTQTLSAVEAVLIPNPKLQHQGEYTLCLSSQWGCRWACQFCQTGEMGFKRHLSCGEILAQLRCAQNLLRPAVDQSANQMPCVSRIVFMGMGEPLENPHLEATLQILSDETKNGGYGLSARRIKVSTVGLAEYLPRFFAFGRPYRLALSVHNPISEERSKLIPAEFSSPLEDVLHLIEQQQEAGDKRRITFEYTLIQGENDQEYHAQALAELALRVGARVNLIACHENSAGYLGSSTANIRQFRAWLEQRQLRCTIRKSQGEEIQAAYGMLAGGGF